MSGPAGARAREVRAWGRDAVTLIPAYVMPGIASLVSVPVLFVALGPGEYGAWALIYAISQGIPTLASSWAEATTLRFGHRASAAAANVLTAASISLSALGGAAGAVVLIPGATTGQILAAAFLSAAVAAYVVAVAHLQSQMRFGSVSAVAATRAIAGIGASVLVGMATHDAAWSIVGLGGGFLGAAALAYRRPRRERSDVATDGAGEPDRRTLGAYGAAAFATALGLYVLSVGDRFILSNLGSREQVGIYAATYAIADLLVRFGPSVIIIPLRIRLFQGWDAGERSRGIDDVVLLSAISLWVLAWVTLAFMILGPAVPTLPIDGRLAGPLAAGSSLFVAASVLSLWYSTARRHLRLAVHTCTAAVANLGLNLALVPLFGSFGAAMATFLSYGLLWGLHALTAIEVRRALGPQRLLIATSGVIGLTAVAVSRESTAPWPLVVGAVVVLVVSLPAVISQGRASVTMASVAR